MNDTNQTNLTQFPPRSPRVRLGGFAHLPRLIDKARASVSGELGQYEYGNESLLDLEFFKFSGITAEELQTEVAKGGGDLAILEWVQEHASRPLAAHEIAAWSRWIENVPGLSTEARAWFAEYSANVDPPRPDVGTLFEYLDLDDYLHFGGKA